MTAVRIRRRNGTPGGLFNLLKNFIKQKRYNLFKRCNKSAAPALFRPAGFKWAVVNHSSDLNVFGWRPLLFGSSAAPPGPERMPPPATNYPGPQKMPLRSFQIKIFRRSSFALYSDHVCLIQQKKNYCRRLCFKPHRKN